MVMLTEEQIDYFAERILSIFVNSSANPDLQKAYAKGVVAGLASALEEIIIRSMAASIADRFEQEDDPPT